MNGTTKFCYVPKLAGEIMRRNMCMGKSYRELKQLKRVVDFKPEIFDALAGMKVPVVALESTIITHGMPFRHNLKVAVDVEEIVRNKVNFKIVYNFWPQKILIMLQEPKNIDVAVFKAFK